MCPGAQAEILILSLSNTHPLSLIAPSPKDLIPGTVPPCKSLSSHSSTGLPYVSAEALPQGLAAEFLSGGFQGLRACVWGLDQGSFRMDVQ